MILHTLNKPPRAPAAIACFEVLAASSEDRDSLLLLEDGLIAEQDAIDLNDAHWEIIELQRNYYETYKIAPVTRVLIKIVKEALGPEKGNSIYLMKLFTGKPAKISAKIAGLPKPTNCD